MQINFLSFNFKTTYPDSAEIFDTVDNADRKNMADMQTMWVFAEMVTFSLILVILSILHYTDMDIYRILLIRIYTHKRNKL